MRLSFKEKISRLLIFLRATSNRVIFAALATRGFTQAERNRMFELVVTASGGDLVMNATDRVGLKKIKEAIMLLDFWENTWYPLLKASLKYQYPEIAEKIFFEIKQTDGMELLITVPKLIERIEALENGDETDQQAFAKLETRGFNQEIRTQGKELIEQCKEEPDELDPGTAPEIKEAEKEMWAWYSEWAAIARTVITRKDHLIWMGLKKAN